MMHMTYKLLTPIFLHVLHLIDIHSPANSLSPASSARTDGVALHIGLYHPERPRKSSVARSHMCEVGIEKATWNEQGESSI